MVRESWPAYDHVNVQAGLDAWLEGADRVHQLVGMVNHRHRDFGLSELMQPMLTEFHGPGPGNVSRVNLATGPGGEVRPCVTCGLYLVVEGELRGAVLFRSGQRDMGQPETTLEITATDPAFAARIAADVRRLAVEHNVYRGQVVSFDHDVFGERETVLSFHARPDMTADELILPRETTAAITRQVVGVARHRARLLAARQHLKRGPAPLRTPGSRQDTHRALPDQSADGDDDRRALGQLHAHDRGGLLGGPDPATSDDRGRGRRPHRGGTRHAPRRASAAVPAPQRDGRASRGRRRGLPPDDQPRRSPRTGARAAPRPGGSGGGTRPSGPRRAPPTVRPLPRRP